MIDYERAMQERKEHLLRLEGEILGESEDKPEGSLRVRCKEGCVQYFRRTEKKDTSGTYIPQKDIALARALAQKDYNQKALCSIEKEIKAIERYLTGLPKTKAEEVYESLHIERQKLITPIWETDEQYIRSWEQVAYQGKRIDNSVPIIMTEKGEQVRSKSEMMIADALCRERIPYRYECPLYLNGFGWIHPDFTILNVRKRKEVYWEHLGMMDDPMYAEKSLHKIANYEKNGYILGDNLIITWETKNYPITQKDIKRMIMQHLK